MKRLILVIITCFGVYADDQIDFEHQRLQAYQQDIPSFSKGKYLEKQSELLLRAEKAIKQQDVMKLDDYPTGEKRSYIHFIVDIETGETIAVFKSGSKRIHEVLTWELAGILGLEEVFTPSMPITLYGIQGELQIYQKNDLTTQQSYYESLYPFITFDSYLKCALGVFVFALEDMHNENCFYRYCKEGYINMGLFDTLVAFDRTRFTPLNIDSNYPSLMTPYNWIGWDFPQTDRKITKKFKDWLVHLISSWPGRIEDLKSYFNHPMTPYNLTDSQIEGIVERATILHDIISKHPENPARIWHEALVPNFSLVEKKLKDFSPKYKTTWLLFRLQWFPNRFYTDWISNDRHEEFKYWLQDFLDLEAK